jgi:hypothetical protein
VRSLLFEKGQFDAVIDKACFDCILVIQLFMSSVVMDQDQTLNKCSMKSMMSLLLLASISALVMESQIKEKVTLEMYALLTSACL